MFRAGRPIHEMGASVLLRFLPERGLTAMRNRTTLLRAKQSRGYNCALFASCGCGALGTEYCIRDGSPSDLTGLLYPARFGGFCAFPLGGNVVNLADRRPLSAPAGHLSPSRGRGKEDNERGLFLARPREGESWRVAPERGFPIKVDDISQKGKA